MNQLDIIKQKLSKTLNSIISKIIYITYLPKAQNIDILQPYINYLNYIVP